MSNVQEVEPVILYLCVIREKLLTGAGLKKIEFLWQDSSDSETYSSAGLQVLFEGVEEKEQDLRLLSLAATRLDVPYLNPSAWVEAETGHSALSDVIKVKILYTEELVKLFRDLRCLDDPECMGDGERFNTIAASIFSAARTYRYDKEFFLSMCTEMLQNFLNAVNSVPKMIIIT